MKSTTKKDETIVFQYKIYFLLKQDKTRNKIISRSLNRDDYNSNSVFKFLQKLQLEWQRSGVHYLSFPIVITLCINALQKVKD